MAGIYVIRCAENKFYVGRTIDIVSRWNAHTSGLGALWTKHHRPLQGIIELLPDTPYQELVTTLTYMQKYGIHNVRGGPWCSLILTETEINTIEDIMKSEGFARTMETKIGSIGPIAPIGPSTEGPSATMDVEPEVPARKGKVWAAMEDSDLLLQLSQSMDIATIARIHGRSEGSIKSRVTHHAKRLRDEGRTFAQVGEILNITDDDVQRCFHHRTPEIVRFRKAE
jgi:hypothetical protein